MVGTGVDQANNSRNSNKSEQRTKPSSSLPKSDEGLQQRTTPFDQSEDQSNINNLPKRTRPERRRQDNQGRSQESDQNRQLITESLPQRSARERTQRNLPQKEQSTKEVYQPRDQGEEL